MFVKDGIAYAGGMRDGIKVVSARAVGNLCLLVEFSTGETRLFDATVLLDGEVYKPLADERVLRDFSIDHGVISWLNGTIDIAPEGLYARSFEYERTPGGARR